VRRVIPHHVQSQPGLGVSFVEAGRGGGEQLGAARGTRGTIRFIPSEAAAGVRTIDAVLTENGLPRPGFVVTHYRAGPPRPGRVRRLTVRRRRGGLLVSFRSAPLAESYAVTLSLSDGRSLLLSTGGTKTSLFVPHVLAVSAVENLGVIALRGSQRGPLVRLRGPSVTRTPLTSRPAAGKPSKEAPTQNSPFQRAAVRQLGGPPGHGRLE
jgi:hypothetical protein